MSASQGPLWPVCCGRAKLGYSGLLRDHFGQCAVEELSWATQGYSGTTLASVEELSWATQGYWDHFGQCAVEELSWATQGYSGTTLASVLWKS